ncbi:hypothetical protein BC936DRAFT_141628 [Jimgerdemannia flammicorona]|uniref:Uncharacterized protein n=1 Tax=Jimgerdemannia flammicorona TaxID=994334 RepID=A0A433A1X0_9FUNG|nr:hypothetical protein BC936DRAFT_141628 [Jimgerdemannia flammicorona]
MPELYRSHCTFLSFLRFSNLSPYTLLGTSHQIMFQAVVAFSAFYFGANVKELQDIEDEKRRTNSATMPTNYPFATSINCNVENRNAEPFVTPRRIRSSTKNPATCTTRSSTNSSATCIIRPATNNLATCKTRSSSNNSATCTTRSSTNNPPTCTTESSTNNLATCTTRSSTNNPATCTARSSTNNPASCTTRSSTNNPATDTTRPFTIKARLPRPPSDMESLRDEIRRHYPSYGSSVSRERLSERITHTDRFGVPYYGGHQLLKGESTPSWTFNSLWDRDVSEWETSGTPGPSRTQTTGITTAHIPNHTGATVLSTFDFMSVLPTVDVDGHVGSVEVDIDENTSAMVGSVEVDIDENTSAMLEIMVLPDSDDEDNDGNGDNHRHYAPYRIGDEGEVFNPSMWPGNTNATGSPGINSATTVASPGIASTTTTASPGTASTTATSPGAANYTTDASPGIVSATTAASSGTAKDITGASSSATSIAPSISSTTAIAAPSILSRLPHANLEGKQRVVLTVDAGGAAVAKANPKKGGSLRARMMDGGKKAMEEEEGEDDDNSDIEKDLPVDPIKRREILALRIRSLNIQKVARKEAQEKKEWMARKREERNEAKRK